MDKELKIKIICAGVCGFLTLVFLVLAIFLHEASVFLVPSFFLLLILIILEAYLRIQHNIDRVLAKANLQESQYQSIVNAQAEFSKELETGKKIYEDILDLLEILIDYLEEMKEKDSRQEEVLKALENLKKREEEIYQYE
jgi:hypothetical protein